MSLGKTMIPYLNVVAYASALANLSEDDTINLDDKKTYPYIRNLAGLPAKYNSTSIKITSLDSGEVIDLLTFDKEVHVLTISDFKKHGSTYEYILTNYPNDITYVQGLLIDMGTLEEIASKENGDILYYDKELVSPRETNLIPKISEAIRKQLKEYDLPLYQAIDDQYVIVLQYVIYALIEVTILKVRKQARETAQVSEEDMEARFSSYYFLSSAAKVLHDDVRLWLYHSLPYLSTHIGFAGTLEDLRVHVANPMGFDIVNTVMLPTPPLVDGTTFRYNTAVYDIRDNKSVETPYRDLFAKTHENVPTGMRESVLDKTINVERTKTIERRVKDTEHTRFYKLTSYDKVLPPTVNEEILKYDILLLTTLKGSRYNVILSDGSLISLTGVNMFTYTVGCMLTLLGVDTDAIIARYRPVTIFNNIPDPLYNIVDEGAYQPMVDAVTEVVTSLSTDVATYYKQQVRMHNIIRDHIGLHRNPIYYANAIRIYERYTYGERMDIGVINVKERLSELKVRLPGRDMAYDTLIRIVREVTGLDLDADALLVRQIKAVNEIINKLTSYTIEGDYEEPFSTLITMYTVSPSVIESLNSIKVGAFDYKCAEHPAILDADPVVVKTVGGILSGNETQVETRVSTKAVIRSDNYLGGVLDYE